MNVAWNLGHLMVLIFPVVKRFRLPYSDTGLQRLDTAQLIARRTQADDSVLIRGAEGRLNFMVHRRSPGRFAYLYPLLAGTFSEEATSIFKEELQPDPPKLIIDSLNCATPFERELAEDFAANYGYSRSRDIDRIVNYIHSNYYLVETVGPEQWRVYQYTGVTGQSVILDDPAQAHGKALGLANLRRMSHGPWSRS
jgi:hypothetical protein